MGAGGFLGAHVVSRLRAGGHECETSGLDRPRVEVSDQDAIEHWFSDGGVDVLVQAAWYAGDDRINSAQNEKWVHHTRRLLDAFVRAGGRKVITMGSCFEYELGSGALIEDVTPIRPHNPYGRAKAAVEAMVAQMTAENSLQGVHARVGYVYGPGERPPRVVPALVDALAQGHRFASTSGRQRRDYLYAGDVGRAIALLVDTDFAGPINVASGRAIAVADLLTAVAAEVGPVDLLDLGALPQRAGDPEVVELSIQRITDLGWQPEIDLAEGVRLTVRSMLDDSSRKAPLQ